MTIIQSAFAFLTSIVSAFVAIFGINMQTEQPKYVMLERISGAIEIREYQPRVAAETTIDTTKAVDARREAFGLVAGYIFGANKTKEKVAMTSPVEISSSGTKIAMTAPVEVNKSDSALVMRFFMPSQYSINQLPEPTDSRIKLIEIPKTKVAALQFSGSTGDRAVAERATELTKALGLTNWKIAGPATAYFYNPPWTLPFLRTNEVVIPVAK